jgi:hypothetical protein
MFFSKFSKISRNIITFKKFPETLGKKSHPKSAKKSQKSPCEKAFPKNSSKQFKFFGK